LLAAAVDSMQRRTFGWSLITRGHARLANYPVFRSVDAASCALRSPPPGSLGGVPS
jgi:hypothetical protein